jgi:imidazolonepropionase-like amidohydrolase
MRVRRHLVCYMFLLLLVPCVCGQQPTALSPLVQKYVRVNTPKVVGDRNVVIEQGKITALDAGSDTPASEGTTVLDLRGYTVIPGIVGMHNHLFYVGEPDNDGQWNSEPPELLPQMTFSAPRLYLAGGVTTMRTTGSVETYTDLNLKRAID